MSLDRLDADERAVVSEATDADEVYGLLRPVEGSSLTPRSATTDLALLLLTLREPGPLPSFATRRLGEDADETIARLVLDAVLEVERDGAFVSGPRALAASQSSVARSRVGELSLAALEHAQQLEGLDETLLALRLYCFGRRPLTPALQARFPDERAVAAFLGVDRPSVRTGWGESGTKPGEPWRMWRRRRPQRRGGASFKLYVAPALEAMPDALAAVARTLAEVGSCEGFKVAREVAGLARPDKLVAYFARLEDLHTAAAALAPLLRGLPSQPVPFTGAVDADGLLSWGVDPAAHQNGGRSWRLWLAGRLASYLVEGRVGGGGAEEPWRFALERVRLDGIDVESWAPASTGWDGTR